MASAKEEMSIHRALSELKLTESKYQNAVQRLDVCALKTLKSKIGGRYEEDEFNKNQTSLMQKVNDLLNRYIKIKSEIMKSNNTTVANVNGEELTITEVLARKESIRLKVLLHEKLSQNYFTTVNEQQRRNEKIKEEANKISMTALGGKDAKSEEVDKYVKEYLKNNEFKFIDPIKVETKLSELTEEINVYKGEIDIVLSESNAMTKIFI